MQILSLKRFILAIFVLMTCVSHSYMQAQPLQPLFQPLQIQMTTCSTKGVIMCAWWDRITRDLHDDITILALTQNNQIIGKTDVFTAAIRADVAGCAAAMGQTLLPNNSAGALQIQDAVLAYFDAGFNYLNTLTTTHFASELLAKEWMAQGTILAETIAFLTSSPLTPPVVFATLNDLIQALIAAQISEINIYNSAAQNGTPDFGPDGFNRAFSAIQLAGEIGFFIGELAL